MRGADQLGVGDALVAVGRGVDHLWKAGFDVLGDQTDLKLLGLFGVVPLVGDALKALHTLEGILQGEDVRLQPDVGGGDVARCGDRSIDVELVARACRADADVFFLCHRDLNELAVCAIKELKQKFVVVKNKACIKVTCIGFGERQRWEGVCDLHIVTGLEYSGNDAF